MKKKNYIYKKFPLENFFYKKISFGIYLKKIFM